jgi:predicted 3-demethylubiquinone-9 3-methyltransferase (glyoxalase superfamily)
MLKGRKIKTFLWFEDQAEQAARFYTSIFRDGKLGSVARYPEGGPGPAGGVMTVEFDLDGRSFVALNGGPQFKFNESVSFAVECDSQEEIDYYWDKLLAGGGQPRQCGWLKDRFGAFWQVMPAGMAKIFSDAKTAPRVMQAMLKMVKLDIAKLKEAAK